jgi:hypothetical protein
MCVVVARVLHCKNRTRARAIRDLLTGVIFVTNPIKGERTNSIPALPN